MTTTTAKSLYETVGGLGLSRAQARRLLPDWWTKDTENAPNAAPELAMLLARRLSLDVGALLDGHLVAKGAVRQIAYKHQAGVTAGSLTAASFLASSLGQAVGAAMPVSYRPWSSDPDTLRRELMRGGDRKTVGFDALLAMCWSHGVPVIPLPNLPVGVRKMDGAALHLADRPVVVIAKRQSSRAWLAFILAHEIGHIACGHIQPGSSIVDASLQDMATYATESASDQQEREADAFALHLLGGHTAEGIINGWPSRLSPVELAVRGRESGQAANIEPGHLILRYAFAKKRWPEAIAALRFLSEDLDADVELRRTLAANVEFDRIADDLQDMVLQVTGATG